MRYQTLGSPRFEVDSLNGADRIIIRPARRVFLSTFMLFWLAGWTYAGASALATLQTKFSPFLLFWMGGWALGELYVLMQLGWTFTGSETLSVRGGGDLQIAYRIFGFTISKLYRGGDIRDLSADVVVRTARYEQATLPFLSWNKVGCIHFAYGARTIYIGADLDIVEGRLIVERLLKRLPASVKLRPS